MLTVVACGARNDLEGAGPTSGSGGGGGSITTASSSSSSATGSGGSGGNVCGIETHDGVSFEVARHDGSKLSCAGSMPGSGTHSATYHASIVKVDGGVITLDECSPAADCIAQIGTVTVDSARLGGFILEPGTFVTVRAELDDNGFACASKLLIENLPNWDGQPNPVDTTAHDWLGASALGSFFEDADFQVATVAQHCFPNEMSSGCGEHDDYVFHVTSGDAAVDVPMGQTLGVGPHYVFANLQSYTVDVCDASARFSWLLFIPALER